MDGYTIRKDNSAIFIFVCLCNGGKPLTLLYSEQSFGCSECTRFKGQKSKVFLKEQIQCCESLTLRNVNRKSQWSPFVSMVEA